ncbi:UNVERIFIED_CONTAM: hypothetical protein NCL1_28469 [Trichonephila clavipes]
MDDKVRKCNYLVQPPPAALNAAIQRGMESKYLLVEENSGLLVCAAKVRLLKLKDADHERDAVQPNLTRTQ